MVHLRTSEGVVGVVLSAVKYAVGLVYRRCGPADALFSYLTSFTDDFAIDVVHRVFSE